MGFVGFVGFCWVLLGFVGFCGFRVVNQVHCPATKKNKEWQEKLPIVVLKAEEILYSKADSEVRPSLFPFLKLSVPCCLVHECHVILCSIDPYSL